MWVDASVRNCEICSLYGSSSGGGRVPALSFQTLELRRDHQVLVVQRFGVSAERHPWRAPQGELS